MQLESAIDHIVIAAQTLDQGQAWCEERLGASPLPGGQHPLMGTHNRLLQISSAECPQCYLEIIAIDPAAKAPRRPRWFGLDDAALQARLASTGPELVSYVARSNQINTHRWALLAAHLQPGEVVTASRQTPNGLLEWQIAIPDDGRPLAGGAVPMLIQWQGGHPADRLPESGVGLTAITVRGMADIVAQGLKLQPITRASRPGAALSAHFNTPKGAVTLHSHTGL